MVNRYHILRVRNWHLTGRLRRWEYIKRGTYPDPSLAMAGRQRIQKLASVRDEMRPAMPITPLIEADPLTRAVAGRDASHGRVVIITTGRAPYLLLATAGRGLCQSWHRYATLGRAPFMWDMIEEYQRLLCQSQRCADRAFIVLRQHWPFDMGVFFLQTRSAKRFGAPLRMVKGRVRGI